MRIEIAMTEILLFTKPGCQKCDYVKARIPDGLAVEVVDTSQAEGLAEAAYYELLNKPTPVLVVDDVVVEGSINIMNKLKALADQS
jgi:glutaredoxin